MFSVISYVSFALENEVGALAGKKSVFPVLKD